MPALFAYLIAMGLLLGGGYGALSWLAAPEPVKVIAKTKAKYTPPSHYADDSTRKISNDNRHPENDKSDLIDETPQTVQAASGQDLNAVRTQTMQTQTKSEFVTAKASPAEEKIDSRAQVTDKPGEQPVQTIGSGQGGAQSKVSRPAPRAHSQRRAQTRLANRHGGKRSLTLMTLRTIEFNDGRRVTQLIPYRGGADRLLAFGPDE
jgi:hypothetical protein